MIYSREDIAHSLRKFLLTNVTYVFKIENTVKSIQFLYNAIMKTSGGGFFIRGTGAIEDVNLLVVKTKIELLKLGITAGLLNVLEENDQIKNIEKDQYGNIQGNAKLKNFYMAADDYTKFEIGKYIKII